MKKIWNDKSGTVDDCFDNFESVALYKIGKIYWEIIKDNDTGKLTSGWIDEFHFDGVFGKQGYVINDFIEIKEEDIVALLAQKKISTPLHLTDGRK